MKIFIIACIFLATAFADDKDKCVSGYDACVKANGADALSRLSCGVGYLKCRFSSIVSEDDDVMFDDSTSCTSELKTCIQTEGSDKKECMKKFKECVSVKITDKKEAAKKKYECVKKCKNEGMKCLKSGASKKECFVKATKCAKACFSKDDDDKLLFVDSSDDEELEGKDDKCVTIYKKCVAKLGKGFINRIKCGKAYIKCRKAQGSEKVACVKKCKISGYKCLKNNGTKKECFVNATKCAKACFSKDDDDKLLFVEADEEEKVEGKDDKCVTIYKKCVAKLGKGFINRMKCGKAYIKCRKSQGSEKVACFKKCKIVGYKCLKNNGTKKECFMNATKCAKACFTKDDDDKLLFLDEPVEESKDKCVSGYDFCVKANGADALSRLSCGVGYLKCRFSSVVNEDDDVMFDDSIFTDKIEATKKKPGCFKKCKAVALACIKKGKSAADKKKCVKSGYVCAKKCFA